MAERHAGGDRPSPFIGTGRSTIKRLVWEFPREEFASQLIVSGKILQSRLWRRLEVNR